jgi:hypothetical protein
MARGYYSQDGTEDITMFLKPEGTGYEGEIDD